MTASADPFEKAREAADAPSARNLELVERFFSALGDLDFERASSDFTEDAVYHDSPVPDRDAKGPEGVCRKLHFALDGVERLVLRISRVVASGDLVMSERIEEWHFSGGAVASVPVMCVHEVRDGKISGWREYWDFQSLVSQMPAEWLESYAKR